MSSKRREVQATRLAENITANIIFPIIGKIAEEFGERIKKELLAGRTITRKQAIKILATVVRHQK
jgi:hypothetical protein